MKPELIMVVALLSAFNGLIAYIVLRFASADFAPFLFAAIMGWSVSSAYGIVRLFSKERL